MKRNTPWWTSPEARTWRRGLVSAVAALALSAGAAACAKSGTGVGIAKSPGQPVQQVAFAWDSGSLSLSGNIATTLPDGETYQGRFLQLTSDAVAPAGTTYWGGWGWDSYDWGWGWGYGGPTWVTEYSGVVIASLASGQGNTMRCIFRLENPASGLAGGGIGRCRTSEGLTIENALIGEGQEVWAQRNIQPRRPPSG